MKPELLSPAGTLKNMKYAFAYGADAVYAGQPRYSLRVRNNDFNMENLQEGITLAHSLGKKLYVASNIAPHNSKIKTYMRDIEPVIKMKPDALIMSDPGLIMMVKDKWPDVPIHLSVQANVVNYAAVKFWHRQGIERIILSRELSLNEIEEIRMLCPEMELEVFVHGALCIAYSGRCLLSGYMNKRDPNQGSCTNACRWKYDAHEAVETPGGDLQPLITNASETSNILRTSDQAVQEFNPTLGVGAPSSKIFMLEEQGRPGEFMPAFEDEHGTYIMNSKDLRAIQHVQRLTELGIHSLKIEGRTKSHYYVARTAQLYRQAIEDAYRGSKFDMSLMDELEKLSNRGYTEGFYRRHVHDEYQNYERGASFSTKQRFVGEVMAEAENGWMMIDVKNNFKIGDVLELMTSAGNITFTLKQMLDKYDNPREVAPGSGLQVKIPLPEGATTVIYGLLVQNLDDDSKG